MSSNVIHAVVEYPRRLGPDGMTALSASLGARESEIGEKALAAFRAVVPGARIAPRPDGILMVPSYVIEVESPAEIFTGAQLFADKIRDYLGATEVLLVEQL